MANQTQAPEAPVIAKKWSAADSDAIQLLTQLGGNLLADLQESKPGSQEESTAWAGLNLTTRAVFYLLNPFKPGISLKHSVKEAKQAVPIEGDLLLRKCKASGADRFGKGETWR